MRYAGLMLLLASTTFVFGADKVEVIGVAKVGDGSEVAKAWASRSQNAIAGPGNPEWVIAIKHDVNPQEYSVNSYLCAKEGLALRVSIITLPGQPTMWIEIRKPSASAPNEIQKFQALLNSLLNRANVPLSADQKQQITVLLQKLACPELAEAWSKVESAPTDKVVATAFVEKIFAERRKGELQKGNAGSGGTEEVFKILTPEQMKALQEAGGNGKRGEGYKGGIAYSKVMVNGKMTLAIEVQKDVELGRAVEAFTERINAVFKTALKAPQVHADLVHAKPTVKLTITDPQKAMEQFAAAAGAKLQEQNGTTTLVPAK